MSDFDPSGGVTITNPTSGAEIAAYLQALAQFALSSGYGASVPTNAEAGQIWAENTGGTPDPKIFDGTDSFLIYTIANILGTVSADGAGANTGAVIEVGESAGTFYMKLAGGIAICAANVTVIGDDTTEWSLPITFSDTAKMAISAVSRYLAGARVAGGRATATDTVEVRLFDVSDTLQAGNVDCICIGFWTEEFI